MITTIPLRTLSKILNIIKKHGLSGLLEKSSILLSDYWFDLRNGVDTRTRMLTSGVEIASDSKLHGHRYEPARVSILRMILPRLRTLAPQDATFIDIGSGKGRVLMLAAESGFKKVKGIEVSSDLCRVAVKNCAVYTSIVRSRATFNVIAMNAANYHPDQGDDVFFLFNPFDDTILDAVLNNIAQSVLRYPRTILICYYCPRFQKKIESDSRFHQVMDLETLGYTIKVFSTAPSGDGARERGMSA
jgi:SAM-dependent methyltransferase